MCDPRIGNHSGTRIDSDYTLMSDGHSIFIDCRQNLSGLENDTRIDGSKTILNVRFYRFFKFTRNIANPG